MIGTMTLKMIKEMFQPGQRWHVVRKSAPLVVHGNAGTTVMGNKHADEIRVVEKVGSKDIIFLTPDGERYWTAFPKAREVIDAWGGHLKFAYDNQVEVTLDLIPA